MHPAKHILHHDRYDYRDIWLRSTRAAAESETLQELLPRFGQLIGETMFIQQLGIWLASEETEDLKLAYIKQPRDFPLATTVSLKSKAPYGIAGEIFSVARSSCDSLRLNKDVFENLGIDRVVLLVRGERLLGILGVGKTEPGHNPSTEDDEVLLGMSRQLAHSIFSHRVSEEVDLARQRNVLSPFSSFVIHDLKNVATLQNMTLENAKNLKQDREFIEDAFTSFAKTTDKLMNLIGTLSMRKGQFSPKQKPVNLIVLIKSTVEELKIVQRNGVELVTDFPNQERAMTLGDWELLKKAFTNILLNAIQSLPDGKGRIEILVSPQNRQISTTIVDTGCGMSPEQLAKVSQPFQTTKERGSGIGLCHTRSILGVHGGKLRLNSQQGRGTRVEIVLSSMPAVDT